MYLLIIVTLRYFEGNWIWDNIIVIYKHSLLKISSCAKWWIFVWKKLSKYTCIWHVFIWTRPCTVAQNFLVQTCKQSFSMSNTIHSNEGWGLRMYTCTTHINSYFSCLLWEWLWQSTSGPVLAEKPVFQVNLGLSNEVVCREPVPVHDGNGEGVV